MSARRMNATLTVHIAGFVLLTALLSCSSGSSSSTGAPSNPVGSVAVTVSPSASTVLTYQTTQFSAVVTGTSDNRVTWQVNGTTGSSSTTGTINSTGLYTAPSIVPSTASIQVTATSVADTTKSGTSVVNLQYPAPTTATVSPTAVLVGTATTTITVTGTGFTPASTVTLAGTPLSVQFTSATQLTASVGAAQFASAGNEGLIVSNPTPGGGASAAATLSVQNAIPMVLALSPAAANVGAPDTLVTISGTGFASGTQVILNGSVVPTVYVDAGTLVTTVPATMMTTDAVVAVTAQTPAPGGGISLEQDFTVGNPNTYSGVVLGGATDPDPSTRLPLLGNTATSDPTVVTPAARTPTASPRVAVKQNPNCGTNPNTLCIPGVPWISQVPPGDPSWNGTHNCGPASLAMVEGFLLSQQQQQTKQPPTKIDYEDVYLQLLCKLYEPNTTYDACKIKNATDATGDGANQTISTLVALARSQSFAPNAKLASSSIDNLRSAIGSGNPVIVAVNTQSSLTCNTQNPPSCTNTTMVYCAAKSLGHFMVVVGIDADDTGNVYVNDPGRGQTHSDCAQYRAFSIATFEPVWANHGYSALVLDDALGINSSYANVGNTITIPDGKAGEKYSAELQSVGGTSTYTWSISVLPRQDNPGLTGTQSGSEYTLSGTAPSAGSYTFAVTVSDSAGKSASRNVSWNVASTSTPLQITSGSSIPNARVNVAYAGFHLTVAGGVPPYTWTSTSLPVGLSMDQTGYITGTASTTGADTFTAIVKDSGPIVQTQTALINATILPQFDPPVVNSVTSAATAVASGSSNVVNCLASGGDAPLAYAWQATGGTVTGSGNTVTWIAPSTSGFYTLTCTVTDRQNQTASGTLVLGVTTSNGKLLTSVSPSTGTANSTQFTVSGVGASAAATVLALSHHPDGTTKTFTTVAASDGSFKFQFVQSLVGQYSETYTDTKLNITTAPLTYTVTSPSSVKPTISIGPASGVIGVTPFTKTGSGFSKSSTVTQGVIYPSGGLTNYKENTDANGSYSLSNLVYSTQTGTYTETDTDDMTGATSNTISWTVTGSPSFNLSVDSATKTVTAGASAVYTLTISSAAGFNSPVALKALNWSAVPASTAFWTPITVTPPPDGSVTSAFTLNTAATTATGTYSFSLNGTNGSTTQSITVTLVVQGVALHPQISVSPGTGTIGITPFTKTGTGFSPTSAVTEKVTYPNGGLTTFTVNTDSTGKFSLSNLLYASQIGTYTETDVDVTGATSNTITWTVAAAVSPHIGVTPSSGTLGVTSFTKTGSGFTPNSTVTQNITYPNGGLTTFTASSDSSGNYTNSGLIYSSQIGTYTETDTDISGAKSNTVTWTVTAAVSPHISITPTSGTLGVTGFTKTGSGFTHNSTVTQNITYPNGGLTTFTASSDSSGNYTNSGLIYSSQIGTYTETDTDISGAKSNTMTWTVH